MRGHSSARNGAQTMTILTQEVLAGILAAELDHVKVLKACFGENYAVQNSSPQPHVTIEHLNCG